MVTEDPRDDLATIFTAVTAGDLVVCKTIEPVHLLDNCT